MKGGRALAEGAAGWFPLGAVVHSTPSAARPTLGLWFREPLNMAGGGMGTTPFPRTALAASRLGQCLVKGGLFAGEVSFS